MLKISKKGGYALFLLSFLAKLKAEKIVSLKEISKQTKMPYKFLSQIAPILVNEGFLGSKEGVGGGYFLVKKPEEVSLGEVLVAIEGPVEPVECIRKKCDFESECMQKHVFQNIASSFTSEINKYSLADIIDNN